MSDDLGQILREGLEPPPPPPAELRSRVLSAISSDARRSRRRRAWRSALAFAAAAGLVLWAGHRVVGRHRPPGMELTTAEERFVLGDDAEEGDENAMYDLAAWCDGQ